MLPTRGYVFIGLNMIRILSIVALLLVFASSIVVMVNDIRTYNRFIQAGLQVQPNGSAYANSTDSSASLSSSGDRYILDSTVPNQPAGVFWAVLNRLLIIGQTVVLLFSEVGWPSRLFENYFPVLGKDFGLGAAGVIQCLIGAAILSHYVDELSLVSAFFLFSVGCVNILVGLIWRESARAKRSVTDWRESKKDTLPKNLKDLRPMVTGSSPASTTRVMSPAPPSFHSTGRSIDEKMGILDPETAPAVKWAGYGFGRQGEKAAANKGYLITKPVEALPRYFPRQTPPNPE